MKKLIRAIFPAVMMLLLSSGVFANNVKITAGSRPTPYTQNLVVFSLSWDNSWNVSGIPGNHDAVWVFIKFRQCGMGGEWQHALLSTTMTDHTLGADITFAQPITTTDRWGNPGSHNTGAMIRRSTLGKGNITTQVCSLKVVGSSSGALFDPTLEYDIAVFGIEMVQVKQGEFFAGDGNGGTYTFSSPPLSSSLPVKFTSEAVTNVTVYTNNYSVNVPAQFPKGYSEFYCMKYEVTQGQYVDFLNTISSTQAIARWYNFAPNYMYNVQNVGSYTATNAPYGDSRDRAMLYMSAEDLMSYLDWAALRPMTEFEYEKACRGPLDFITNERAWGTAIPGDLVEARTFSGATAGVEVCTELNANCNYNGTNSQLTGGQYGVNSYGPCAVGAFARDATQTRITTGASYWGIMELTGNIWEFTIQPNTSWGNPGTASTYIGTWGDGMLSGTGIYNAPAWPSGTLWTSIRGGGWFTGITYLPVSNRTYINRTNYTSREWEHGGRGVR